MSNQATIEVFGNGGLLMVDIQSGNVIAYYHEEDEPYTNITRIDLAEFKQAYGYDDAKVASISIDILDVGYWCGDYLYEPPVFEWRAGHWVSDPEIRKDIGL